MWVCRISGAIMNTFYISRVIARQGFELGSGVKIVSKEIFQRLVVKDYYLKMGQIRQ